MIASAGGLFVAGNEVATTTETRVAAVGGKDKPVFKGVSFDSAWRLDVPAETPEKLPDTVVDAHAEALEKLPDTFVEACETPQKLPGTAVEGHAQQAPPPEAATVPKHGMPESNEMEDGSPRSSRRALTNTSLGSTPTPSETPSRSDKKARKKFDKYYHRTL